MKLRVPRFRGDEYGNVGVGVVPEHEEILIARLGFDGVTLRQLGAGEVTSDW